MADPLSVAASVAGLLAFGGKILSITTSISSKSPASMSLLTAELTNLRSVLLQIETLFHHHSSLPTRDEPWLIALQKALVDCGDTFLSLEELLKGLVPKGRHDLWKKVKWTLKEADILELQKRLEGYRGLMDLLLNVKTSRQTTNVEMMLTVVYERMTKVATIATNLPKAPVSWKQKLMKMDFLEVDAGDVHNGGASGAADVQIAMASTPPPAPQPVPQDWGWLVDNEMTKPWRTPGVHGITMDEGLPVNFEDDKEKLRSVLKLNLGKHKLEILAKIEDDDWDRMMATGWLIIHLESDVFYIHLTHKRFLADLGNTSMFMGMPSAMPITSVRLEKDVKGLPDFEQCCIRNDGMVFHNQGVFNTILLNFESEADKGLFQRRLYGLRYLIRLGGPKLQPFEPTYCFNIMDCRPQLIQIGYKSRTEKSWPMGSVDLVEDGKFGPRLVVNSSFVARKPSFICDPMEYTTTLVNNHIVVLTSKDPEAEAQTVALTFQELSEAAQTYYVTLDYFKELEFLSPTINTKHHVNTFQLQRIELNDTTGEQLLLPNPTVKFEVDALWRILRVEIIPVEGKTKLAFHELAFDGDEPPKKDAQHYNMFSELVDADKADVPDAWWSNDVKLQWRGKSGKQVCQELVEMKNGAATREREAMMKLLKL